MTLPTKPILPQTAIAALNNQGRADLALYLTKLDALIGAIASGNAPALPNATNDIAARQAGVAVGEFYRNGSVVMVRVT